MSTHHLNLIFPQWQGGGPDLSTYYGAAEFHRLYLRQAPTIEMDVDTGAVADADDGIFAYPIIARQLRHTQDWIQRQAPDTVFTLGGGCDAAIPAAAYLNHRLRGDLTVLWFDAHGDLNTPASSPSRYFYGMPLRTLLGEGDAGILEHIPTALHPRQVIMIGARDLDGEEQRYLQTHAIPIVSVEEARQGADALLKLIFAKKNSNLYIHIDLDVLEPTQFPHVPLPVPGGLPMETLQTLLTTLHREYHIAGLDLMEYNPTGDKRYPLFETISAIGTAL